MTGRRGWARTGAGDHPLAGLPRLARHTPAARQRHLDLFRAVAITAVVLGHWLLVAVSHDPAGRLTGTSALRTLTWAHPLTWMFQVMPVFFLVGGYANAASLTAHRRRHSGGDADWLLARGARLVRPTTCLLLAISLAALGARIAGADPVEIARAGWLASIPLWFLVAYLAMIALTPLTHRAHRRAGPAVPVLLLALVLAGDGLRLWSGDEVWAWGNYLFAWLAIYQVGFLWYDGRLPAGRRGALVVLLGGLAALLGLTVAGPYPVSMVSIPGAAVQNSAPPSLALLALATAQLGLALLLRDPADRWLRRPRPWLAVVALNAVALTMFLWHMAAVVLVTVGLDRLGWLPTPAVESPQWLWWRIPWVMILAVVLAALVVVFAPVEFRAAARLALRADPGGSPGAMVAAVAGYAATLTGLLWISVSGVADRGPFGLPAGALLAYLAGALVLRLARAARSKGWLSPRRPRRSRTPPPGRAASTPGRRRANRS